MKNKAILFAKSFVYLFIATALFGESISIQMRKAGKRGIFYLKKQETGLAVRHFEEALNYSQLLNDSESIVRYSYFLAASYIKEGGYEKAEVLFEKIQFEMKSGYKEYPSVLILKARMRVLQKRFQAARKILLDLLKYPSLSNEEKVQVYLVLSEAAVNESDMGFARNYLALAKKLLPRLSKDFLWGFYYEMAAKCNKETNAGKYLDRALKYYSREGNVQGVARALFDAGKFYEENSEFDKAIDRYLRAARTIFLLGNKEKSSEIISLAKEIVQREKRDDMKETIENYEEFLFSRKGTDDEGKDGQSYPSSSLKAQTGANGLGPCSF